MGNRVVEEKQYSYVKCLLHGLFLLGITSFGFAQNTEMYFSLIQEGRIEEVRQHLPELISKYPNNDGVHFLVALTTVSGDSSVNKYKKFIKRFPDSRWTDDAQMKIGEYLYARGLYSQASTQFRMIPLKYPESTHIQRAMNLMVKSYDATGETDTSHYYLRVFKHFYPDLQFDQYGYTDLDIDPETSLIRIPSKQAKEKITSSKKPIKPSVSIHVDPKEKPWIIQVGAFGKYNNAKKLKMNLSQNGYTVAIDEIESGGKRLHAVRVLRFSTKSEANRVGKELKRKFSLNYRVINKPY